MEIDSQQSTASIQLPSTTVGKKIEVTFKLNF